MKYIITFFISLFITSIAYAGVQSNRFFVQGESINAPTPTVSDTIVLATSATTTKSIPKYNLIYTEAYQGQIDCLALREASGIVRFYTSVNGTLTSNTSCK